MKTILNISLVLMVVAAAIGSADFISLYRTGEIDKIYEHEGKLTTAHSAISAQPVTCGVMQTAEVSTEPFIAPVTKTQNQPITAMLAETQAIEVAAPETEGVIIQLASISDVQTDIPKVTKKKFSLKMYSRAVVREEEILEDIAEGELPIDSLTGESRKRE